MSSLSKVFKLNSILLLSILATSCGTKVGIQIEKATGVTDFITLNDGMDYTNQATLKVELNTLNQFYALRQSKSDCESALPLNWIDQSVVIQDAYITPAYAPNDTNAYYVRYASLDGSDSGCLSDSVVYDNLAPLTPIANLKSNAGVVIMPTDILHVSPTVQWEAVDDNQSGAEWSGVDHYSVEIHEVGGGGVSPNAFISKNVDKSLIKTLITGYSVSLSFLESETEKYNRDSFNPGSAYVAYVYAYDLAGNKSNAGVSTTWSLDQTPPVVRGIELVSNDLNQSGNNACYSSNNSAQVQFATTGVIPNASFAAQDIVDPGTGAVGSGLDYVLVDVLNIGSGTSIVSGIKVLGTTLVNVNLNTLATAQGKSFALSNNIKYALKVTAYDKAGNASTPILSNSPLNTSGENHFWLVDKVAPVFSPNSFPSIADLKDQTLPTLTGLPLVADAEGLLNTSSIIIEDAGNATPYSLLDTLVANRSYKLKSAAEDCVANVASTISSNQFCVDTEAPTVAALGPISISNINAAAHTFSFNAPSVSDVTPSGGSCNTGFKGIQYQLVRVVVDAFGVETMPMATGDFTTLKPIETVIGTKVIDHAQLPSAVVQVLPTIDYSNLVTGTYKLKVIGYDNVGNTTEILSSSSVGISNEPPDCTNQTLSLESSTNSTLQSGLGGSSVVGASKNTRSTVNLKFSAVVCYADRSHLAQLTANDYTFELHDSQSNPIAMTNPVLDLPTKTFTADAVLSSGKSYYFNLIATNVGGLPTKLKSDSWLVDSEAPTEPALVKVGSAFKNSTTSTPDFTLATTSDLPVRSITLGINNVDVKESNLEVYASNAAGTVSGSAIFTSSAIPATSTSLVSQTVSGLQNGKYYTSKLKTKDNLSNISTASVSDSKSTWLVDTTLPLVNHSFLSSAPTYASASREIKLSLRPRNFINVTAMIQDPIPSGGVAASDINDNKNTVYLFKKSDITGGAVNSGATAVASLEIQTANFNSNLNWPVSFSLSEDVYRLAFSATDNAGNQSNYFVDTNDLLITNTAPSCTGSISLAANASVGNNYSNGNDLFVTSKSNSPDLVFAPGFVCVDGRGNAITSIKVEFWQNGDATPSGTASHGIVPLSNYSKSFSPNLSVDKRYLFKVVPVDSNGLVGNGVSTSNYWVIDDVAPNVPSSPSLNPTTFMNDSTTSPTISWVGVTDNPTTLNSGLKQYKVRIYESNSSGVRSGSAISTDNVTQPTVSFQKSSAAYTNGKYYAAEILAEDNIGKVSGSEAATTSMKWLVDTMAPNIGTPITSGSVTSVPAKQIQIAFGSAANVATDPIPSGGVAASGLNASTYLIKFRNMATSGDTTFSFSPGDTKTYTMPSNGKYKAFITVKDNAGNTSSEFEYATEFIISALPTIALSSTEPLNVSTYPEINGSNAASFPVGIACATDASDTTAHDITFVVKQGADVKSTLSAVATCTTGAVSASPVGVDFSNPTKYPDGNYTITGSFTDSYGNSATYTINVTKDMSIKILTFVFDAQKAASVVNGSNGPSRYTIPDVYSPVPFSGTCSTAGTVKIYLTQNANLPLDPAVALKSASNAQLVTLAPNSNSIFTISCSGSGSNYTFAGSFDYSDPSISGNIGVYATLTDGGEAVSSNSSTLFSKISGLRVPWVNEVASNNLTTDIDEFQSDAQNPKITWGEAQGNANIGGYKIYVVYDNIGNGVSPKGKSDWSQDWTKDFVLLSQAQVGSSATGMDSSNFTVTLNPTFQSSRIPVNFIFTCVAALDVGGNEGGITCSDGYIIDNKCPRDFIPITVASDASGNSDFCVSRFEMATDSVGNNIVPANQLNSARVDAFKPSGYETGNTPENLDIINNLCKNMNSDTTQYSLISNRQWNLVGEAISATTANTVASIGTATGAASLPDPPTYTPSSSSRFLQIKVGSKVYYIHDFAGGRAELVNNWLYSWVGGPVRPKGYSSSDNALNLDINLSADGDTYFKSHYETMAISRNRDGTFISRGGGMFMYSGGIDYKGYLLGMYTAETADYMFDYGYSGTGFRCVSKRYAPPYKGM